VYQFLTALLYQFTTARDKLTNYRYRVICEIANIPNFTVSSSFRNGHGYGRFVDV
jgi:hypothetical protein